MFLLTTVLTSADDLRNNTIAAGLTQEGLEAVRAIRDQDWIASNSFGVNLPNGDWEVQWDSDVLMPYSNRLIKKDASTGMFSYTNGVDTQFRRKITILTIPSTSTYEKIVSASVFWLSANGTIRSLRAESHLYNWR